MTSAGQSKQKSVIHKEQYQIVSDRRKHYDTLLWQVPTVGVAAQGVMVSAAIEMQNEYDTSSFLLFIAFLFGVCVILLFRNLRFHEVQDSIILTEYENSRIHDGFKVVHGRRGPWPGAAHVWFGALTTAATLELVFSYVQFLRAV